MIRFRVLPWVASVGVLTSTGVQAGPLIPGALLAGGTAPNVVTQFSTTGVVLDTLAVTGMTGFMSGVALIGNTVYASDSTGSGVYTLNMLTGVATPVFSNLQFGLGSVGNDLLGVVFASTTGQVRRYSTTGTLLSSFVVNGNPIGIDSDGVDIWVNHFNTSRVERYSSAGLLLDSFQSPHALGTLTSLAYDSDTDTLWLGASQNTPAPLISHYSRTGSLLGSFSIGARLAGGLAYIPLNINSTAPEPGTLALLALGVVGGLAARRRK